jgi:hypothetical protein
MEGFFLCGVSAAVLMGLRALMEAARLRCRGLG